MQLSNLSIMSKNDDYDYMYFPQPPRLSRSYKALCTKCNTNITTVSNAKRIGGICWNCNNSIHSQILIENRYKLKNRINT